MSLFVMNRYEDEVWKKKSDNGQNHLSELLKKIEERKLEREAARAAEQAAESKELKNEVSNKQRKKKKGKKRKIDQLVDKEKSGTELNENLTQNESEHRDESQSAVQKDFTILGQKRRSKIIPSKRVLPQWLSHPEVVSSELNKGPQLDDLETVLSHKLKERLKADGFEKLFPVQARMLSWLLKCEEDYKIGRWVRDTCVSMPTGSGKTLAYALPIIQILQNSFVRLIRCLIVLPVQELANQVYEVFSKYSVETKLKIALITGASSFKEEQEKLVQKTDNGDYLSCVDIVIATPGRLIDHIRKTNGFCLTSLRFLVIDEADRATDWMQYIPVPHSKAPPLNIKNLRSSCTTPAQKLLLSATLSQDPEKLSRLSLFRPILFTSAIVDMENLNKDLNLDEDPSDFISCYGNPSQLKERAFECSLKHKPLAVYHLLMEDNAYERALIFTNSSDAAHRLALLLQSLLKNKNVTVAELSGQLGSKHREETLDKFKQGKLQVLVSSDALARGLDIPKIKLVVSYDLPKYIKGYIHRAGRTGRGGIPGTAVSILLPNQTVIFGKMLGKVGKTIPETEKENLDKLAKTIEYDQCLETLQKKLEDEQEKNAHNWKSKKRLIKS